MEYLEMWNCLFEEIGVWLEVSIKYGDKLVILDIITVHGRLKIPGFVACPDQTVTVDNIDPPQTPFQNLISDQELNCFVT